MVLRLRVPPPANWQNAKCLGKVTTREDDDPWFDEEDDSAAIEFCNGTNDGVECPIRDQCLRFALTNNAKEGVWGGTSPALRRAIRKRWPLKGKEPRDEWRFMTEEEANGHD
jgi:Transcription factor WhiB